MTEELEALKNRFSGRAVLVVSAGPSASEWRNVYEMIRGDDPVVVCVKQAFDIEGLGDICDVHFINPYNLKKYNYKKKPLVVFSDAEDAPAVFNKYDVKMLVRKKKGDSLKNTLAHKRNFDDYLIESSGINRPWGPGIMYESVFHMLVYMGCNKIVTVGWDIANGGGDNKHFYDKNGPVEFFDEAIRKIFVKLRVVPIYNFFRFLIGKKYNHAGMLQGEAEVISESVGSLNNWLASKNVELRIVSGSTWMKR